MLVHLIGLAQERGARTLSELRALAAPRKRRVHGKRQPGARRTERPGVYLFRDRHDQALYVGRARDLRARLRSYFRSDRQRPSVEAALLALARIEWRVLGSELEAALEELRLIRELEPPANSRGRRKEQGVYLRRRGDEFVVSKKPARLGPIGSRRQRRSPRVRSSSCTDAELDGLLQGGPLPRLRARLDHLSESQRYEEAARLARPDRGAGEGRRAPAPAGPAARARALPDRAGRGAGLAEGVLRLRRRCPCGPPAAPGRGRAIEIEAGIALCRSAGEPEETLTAAEAEDLMLLHGFIRRPPPELAVLPLDPERIAEHLSGGRLPRAA